MQPCKYYIINIVQWFLNGLPIVFVLYNMKIIIIYFKIPIYCNWLIDYLIRKREISQSTVRQIFKYITTDNDRLLIIIYTLNVGKFKLPFVILYFFMLFGFNQLLNANFIITWCE